MKRNVCMFLFISMTIGCFSQSMADLDSDPSFKGITIGAPISKYSDILKYQKTDNGKSAYIISDSKYLSIFNIKMDKAIVVENAGKVEAIIIAKEYPLDNHGACVFNPSELEILRSNLTFKYGKPNVDISDHSGLSVAGFRWHAETVMLDIAYLFRGTFERAGLRYLLYQRKDDY